MEKMNSSKKVKSTNIEMLKLATFIELEEVPVEDFRERMQKAGKDLTKAEAQEMLEFLYILTRITIKQFFSPE